MGRILPTICNMEANESVLFVCPAYDYKGQTRFRLL